MKQLPRQLRYNVERVFLGHVTKAHCIMVKLDNLTYGVDWKKVKCSRCEYPNALPYNFTSPTPETCSHCGAPLEG